MEKNEDDFNEENKNEGIISYTYLDEELRCVSLQ
jgi:hypothetical protein